MPTYQDTYEAFQAARAAGDNAAVAVLGDALRKMNGQPVDGPLLPASPDAQFQMMSGPEQAGTAIEDTLRMLSNGMTLGFRDKLAPLLGEKDTGQKTQDTMDRSGFAGKTAEALGMIENPLGMMGRTTEAAGSGLSKFIKGLVTSSGEGAVTSGVDAVGHGDPNVMDAMIKGALFGGGARVATRAGGAGAKAIAGMFDKRPPKLSSADVPVPIHTPGGRTQLEDPLTGGRKSISETKAMDLYARKERAMDFENRINKAERKSKTTRGSSADMRLRGVGEKLLDKNEHMGAEKDALANLAEGSPGRNAASKMSILAPSNLAFSGMGGGLGAGLGYALQGPELAAALMTVLPAAGFVSKMAANRGSRKAAQEALDTIVSGKRPVRAPNAAQETIDASETPIEKLLRNLGIAAARPQSRR